MQHISSVYALPVYPQASLLDSAVVNMLSGQTYFWPFQNEKLTFFQSEKLGIENAITFFLLF